MADARSDEASAAIPPERHGKARVDDRRILSGILFVNRNGLRWRDAASACGPHKTLYNRWKRWGERGVFTSMMERWRQGDAEHRTAMIDAARPQPGQALPEGAPHGIEPAR